MHTRKIFFIVPFCLTFSFALLYGFFQMTGIYAGDSGELVTAGSIWGVPHPPGYPLFTLLANILVRIVPFSTEAFRIGLLSSLPMALSLGMCSLLLLSLTGSLAAGIIGPSIIGLTYPVFLYAVVPEVFGLYALFSFSLMLFGFVWNFYPRSGLLILAMFILGLAFTHHHLIVLLVPPLVMVHKTSFWTVIRKNSSLWWKLSLAFLLGFSFYAYVPIAASQYPPIDWEHAVTWEGFFRLVTRSVYGTFRASQSSGQSLLDRGFNILTLFQYVWQDFRFFGIALIGMGATTLYRLHKKMFLLTISYVGMLLFYLFYAGFPVGADFALGTLERFFVIPYGVFGVLLGIGIAGILSHIHDLTKKGNVRKLTSKILTAGFIMLCVFEIVRIMRLNLYRISPLKTDRTIETLADDILASVPPNAILNLQDDLSIFSVQHALYVRHKRNDVRFILFPHFVFSSYREHMNHMYPDVVFPEYDETSQFSSYIQRFIEANAQTRPIVSDWNNQPAMMRWVPEGLVFRYYPPQTAIPHATEILVKNTLLWESFGDPSSHALGTYRHLLLSDVFRYISKKRVALASFAFDTGNVERGKEEFQKAVLGSPSLYQLYTRLISEEIAKKSCDTSYNLLSMLHYTPQSAPQDIILLYHDFFDECEMYRSSVEHMEREYRRIHPGTVLQ